MKVWRILVAEATALRGWIRAACDGAGPERDTAVQSLKAAGAALCAWALAGWWWDAPMALMAPWTAVVLVEGTVYRSVRSGAQQFVVVVAGTLIAAGAGALTHDPLAAMALALPLTVLLGSHARFGAQGLYAPTAALFVLAYGSYSAYDILHRLLETLLGAVIGIAVNALVLPPVHSRAVRRLHTRLPADCAALLRRVADDVEAGLGGERAEEWHERARRLTGRIDELRSARRWSNESYRLNPARKVRRSPPAPPTSAWDRAWEQVTEHIRTTLRALAETAPDRPRAPALPEGVPTILAELLRAAGDVCASGAATDGAPTGRRALETAYASHARLASLLAAPGRETTPSLGGLMADTQRLLGALREVTECQDQSPGARAGTSRSATSP